MEKQPIDEKLILEQVSDTALQEPVTIEVTISAKNRFHARLQKWGILPSKRTFLIYPIFLGTLIRISKLLLTIDFKGPDVNEEMNGGSYLVLNYNAMSTHGNTLAEIVAMAIRNNRKPPSRSLVNFILQNFTVAEIKSVLGIVIKQMNIEGFMISIVLVKGMSVLESRSASAPNAEKTAASL